MERVIQEDQGGYRTLPLASGEVAERGKLACIDTANAGAIVVGKTAPGLVPIGIFAESFTGNGTKGILIKMHREYQGTWWNNDSAALIANTDRGKPVFMKDAETVTLTATGRTAIGMILDVSPSEGVLVVFQLPPMPAAV
jgi:hypothetical protein